LAGAGSGPGWQEGLEGEELSPVQVVLVDDYPVARQALPGLLAENGILVSATAACASDLEEAFDRHSPEVALIGGAYAEQVVEVARRLAEAGHTPRMLIRTHERELTTLHRELSEEVQGAVSRRTSLRELAEAIRTVAAGGTWFEPGGAPKPKEPRTARLSNRERRVLIELARGSGTEEIADTLHLTTHTIRSHIRNIMRKLSAKSRAHAVAIGWYEGLIDIEV
jgi:DNA-binding NarL/FixJ family response regulator